MSVSERKKKTKRLSLHLKMTISQYITGRKTNTRSYDRNKIESKIYLWTTISLK